MLENSEKSSEPKETIDHNSYGASAKLQRDPEVTFGRNDLY